MGISFSKSQPYKPYPFPTPAYDPNPIDYPPFHPFNASQAGQGKGMGRVTGQGMYLAPGGYAYPVYAPYQPILQGQGYPAFMIQPGPQAPFVPPPPPNRPPTEPPPPLFMPAAQNPNVSSFRSPRPTPGSARRPAATPHPSAIPSANVELQPQPQPQLQPQPQPQLQTQPQPQPAMAAVFPNRDITRVLEPVVPTHTSVLEPSGPRPRTPIRNPLPPPPRDVYDYSPYRTLLNLPQTTALLTSTYGTVARPRDGPSVDRKKSLKGLFHSLSSKRKREDKPASFVPVFIPQPQSAVPTAAAIPAPALTSAAEPSVPPVRFDHSGDFAGFMNHSPHRVLYQNKTYPSALHLHEALKFIDHRPDLAEQIRHCPHMHEVYPLSATFQEFVRSDWGQVFLNMMEEVLYLKFKQHPDLRSLLMNTGDAQLIYTEANDVFWGAGSDGQGSNELGKTLVRVRDRLRSEGHGL